MRTLHEALSLQEGALAKFVGHEEVGAFFIRKSYYMLVVVCNVDAFRKVLEGKCKEEIGDRFLKEYERDGSNPSIVLSGVQFAFEKKNGRCNDMPVIQASASTAKEKGWGPLAYELAMVFGYGLAPDRKSVSASARRVWDVFKNRSDVDRHPFDDMDNPVTPDPSDDCVFHGKDRSDRLNASYTLGPEAASLADRYLRRGRAFEAWFTAECGGSRAKLTMLLSLAFSEMFLRRYREE